MGSVGGGGGEGEERGGGGVAEKFLAAIEGLGELDDEETVAAARDKVSVCVCIHVSMYRCICVAMYLCLRDTRRFARDGEREHAWIMSMGVYCLHCRRVQWSSL